MQKLSFDEVSGASRTILCLGAHPDDIEIGCGGTLLTLLEKQSPLSVFWVVFCSHEKRAKEAAASAEALLKAVKNKTVTLKSFHDGFLPSSAHDVKKFFEELKSEISPDIIFTHYRDDRHQDHKLISDLTWNTWRDHLILEYEVPKYDGDFGSPNLFVPLTQSVCRRKINHILTYFPSQQQEKHWFAEDTFLAVARLRGMESGADNKLAEAFYCRKMVLH